MNVGGQVIQMQGGGLRIPSVVSGVYGQTHVAKLAGVLISQGAKIVSKQFLPTHDGNTRNVIVKSLTPGDVLAYASKPDSDHYEHACILVGPALIACHTRHRLAKDYTDIYFPWVTLLKLP